MMESGNGPYLLIKPWVNFAGFQREEGRNHLIVSMFEPKENEQRTESATTEDYNADYDIRNIPF